MSARGGGVELDRAVDSIRVGSRFRRDLGDLDELCASIRQVGLLEPITITPDATLVCGARRLAAVKMLGWDMVNVWVTASVSTRLAEVLAEEHENTARKPLTPTEAAALYTELKQLYAADAARRQHATRFGAGGAIGGGESPPPAGKAREQAARAITGRDSSWSLEHVAEVQRLADDPSASERVRAAARRELALMDADGHVHPHYLAARAAAGTGSPDPDGPGADLIQAARSAIARATSTDSHRGGSVVGLPPRAVRHYGLRAFLATVDEMDGWWLHYDPVEIAAGLTDEQWQRLSAHLKGTTAFVQAVAAARARRDQPGAQDHDRHPHAAGF